MLGASFRATLMRCSQGSRHRVEKIIPQVTWGISPEHVIGVDGRIPDPQAIGDPAQRTAVETARLYGVEAGAPIAGTPVDWSSSGSSQ